MNRSLVISGLASACLLAACATQAPTRQPSASAAAPALAAAEPSRTAAPALPAGATRTVLAGSVLEIALQKEINTRTSQPKDGFPLTVSRSLEVDGYTVVPAGAPGHGEVVHAQKGGMFGKPAELLLAVRWIEVDGQKIEMRHFSPHTGRDKTVAAGNLAVVPVAGLFSPFVRGGEIVLPVGTLALAQVREDTRIVGSATTAEPQPDLPPVTETAQP